MQSITHKEPNINPIFDTFDRLYTEFSVKQQQSSLVRPSVPECFKPLVDIFMNNGWQGQLNLVNMPFTTVDFVGSNTRNIIVCLSGGKDSIAVVKHYLRQGYNVYLYHLRHINFALTDEYKQAREIADYFNLPLYIDDIKLSEHHDYIEHPMKNMIIANEALQYGIREGIGTNIAFGNYTTSTLLEDNFEYCGGDCKEMWEVYENIISTVIPDFKVNVVLENLSQTLDTVCKDKELLDMSVSCIGRANLRKHKHDWVKNKYGVELPKHRCGQCYKCCVEYIYMADHDLQEYSGDYYKYCMKKLKQNYETEDGIEYSDKEVWQHYFFYDISKSKFYKKY